MAGVLILFITVILLPIVQVAYVGCFNPSTTGPIVFREIRSSSFSLHRPPTQMLWANLDDVAPYFVHCTWATEDGRFFRHRGFDWSEIITASMEAARTRKPARGASTITQQCARSLFLWQGRSWMRKGLEFYYTIWMELLLSKHRILELYVNVIEMGDGIYGIGAASQFYYQKPAADLTDDEAALFVTVLPRPRSCDPLHPDEWMLARKSIVMAKTKRYHFPLPLPEKHQAQK